MGGNGYHRDDGIVYHTVNDCSVAVDQRSVLKMIACWYRYFLSAAAS